MSNVEKCSQQNNFRCAACLPSPKLPSFSTFREVCEHSLQVHRVSLESAVQSSTLLPDKLLMYLCKLCTQDHREIFLCETLVKNHINTHSAFFLKRWKDNSEIKCRICEDVIQETDLKAHVDKFHPIDMFADIKDLENEKLKCSPESPTIQDPHSPLEERKAHSLPNMLNQVTKKMSSWQSSQPATEDSLLWDSCFQPEQLISKYFSKLAPAASVQEEIGETPSKPVIRVKPLNLLQAQVKPAIKIEIQKSPTSQVRSKKLNRRSPSSRDIPSSPSRPSNNRSRRSLSQHKSRSRSPVHTNSKSSRERELPPAKTWQSGRNYSYHVSTGTCLLCGLSVPKNRLAMHNTYNHQDMMFRCKVGNCRTSRRSCYLFAKGLNNHHQNYHQLNKNNHLNTRESMTGLPACMVKISCSKCPYFVLFPDTRPVLKHLWSKHRIEDPPVSSLRYHCRVCERPFSSVEMVVEHSRDHLDDKSLSWTDTDMDQGCTRNNSMRRSSGRIFKSSNRKSRSPSRKSQRSPNRETRRSPNRETRRSPNRETRRSQSGKNRRSPSWNSRRTPSWNSRRSPSRKSRRSPSRNRRSPSRKSRRSPSRKSRRSSSSRGRRSSSRSRSRRSSSRSRRSPSRRSRRSPSRKSRRSPSRKSRRSPSKKSRGSPSTRRSGSPPGNTSQFYKYRPEVGI